MPGPAIDQLTSRYDADEAHAGHVTHLALRLYDELRPFLGIRGRARQMLRAAALLHDVGMHRNPSRHNLASRDIILEEGVKGSRGSSVMIIGCVAAFHRKKVRWEKDAHFLSLSTGGRDKVLKLAAILRIADGLDYCHGQNSTIDEVRRTTKRFEVVVSDGADLDVDVRRANRKADLWHKVMPLPIKVLKATPVTTVGRRRKKKISVAPNDAAPRAARAVMRFHLDGMRRHVEGAIDETDPEDLHQFRVAARRLRTAMKAFGPVIDKKALRPYRDELKWIVSLTGEVRDLDTHYDYLRGIAGEIPGPAEGTFESYVALVEGAREQRRWEMTSALASDRFQNLCAGLERHLTKGSAVRRSRKSVGDIAGRAVGKPLKKVLAFERIVPVASADDLHELRKAWKRLRYASEFFSSLLSGSGRHVRRVARRMQDLLGEIRDRDVWLEHIGRRRDATFDILRMRMRDEQAALFHQFRAEWDAFLAAAASEGLKKNPKVVARSGHGDGEK